MESGVWPAAWSTEGFHMMDPFQSSTPPLLGLWRKGTGIFKDLLDASYLLCYISMWFSHFLLCDPGQVTSPLWICYLTHKVEMRTLLARSLLICNPIQIGLIKKGHWLVHVIGSCYCGRERAWGAHTHSSMPQPQSEKYIIPTHSPLATTSHLVLHRGNGMLQSAQEEGKNQTGVSARRLFHIRHSCTALLQRCQGPFANPPSWGTPIFPQGTSPSPRKSAIDSEQCWFRD